MGFESAELEESNRLAPRGEQDEYRAWFARVQPPFFLHFSFARPHSKSG